MALQFTHIFQDSLFFGTNRTETAHEKSDSSIHPLLRRYFMSLNLFTLFPVAMILLTLKLLWDDYKKKNMHFVDMSSFLNLLSDFSTSSYLI